MRSNAKNVVRFLSPTVADRCFRLITCIINQTIFNGSGGSVVSFKKTFPPAQQRTGASRGSFHCLAKLANRGHTPNKKHGNHFHI